MVTKTELLKKLNSDQLKEIAIAENIKIPRGASKKKIIERLLKLSMGNVRRYLAEYSEHETRRVREHTPPILPHLPKDVLDPDKMKDFERDFAKLGEEVGKLVREKLKVTKLEELADIMDMKLAKAGKKYEKREESKGKSVRGVEEVHAPVSLPVEPSETLPDRITTGYEDLDNVLFGGIPKTYAVILTSASCDERELLVKRFLEAGAKEGQITFHVTIEASDVKKLAEEFQSNFYLFICNPQADAIIETLPNVFKLKGVENLNEINIALTSAFRKLDVSLKGPRRACIEIISDILLHHHAASIRKWLSALIPELKSRGFTILAVMNPLMHPSEEVQAILDLFEGEISIYEKQTKKGAKKHLRITKLYNRRYLENELPLRKEALK